MRELQQARAPQGDLTSIVIRRLIVAQAAFVARSTDPFGIDTDCLNPAGHGFIASCGDVVCPHCGRIAWQ